MGLTSKEFGTVPMLEKIATPEDIAHVVKGVQTLPSASVDGDIVQLIGSQSGYQTGSYYKYIASDRTWVKIEHGEMSYDHPSVQGILRVVDDHTQLVLSGDAAEDGTVIQVVYRKNSEEFRIVQYAQLQNLTVTLTQPLTFYQDGTFVGRVLKNDYSTEFEIQTTTEE